MLDALKFSEGHEKFSGIYKLMNIQRGNRPVWKLVAYMDCAGELHPVTVRSSTFLVFEPSINSWAIFCPLLNFHALCASASPSPENVPTDGWIMHEKKRDQPRGTGDEMIDRISKFAANMSMCRPCEGATVKPLEFSEICGLENWQRSVASKYCGDETLKATDEDLATLRQPFPELQKVKPWF